MIRLYKLTPAKVNAWLVNQPIPATHATYRLRVWQANSQALPAFFSELKTYAHEALDDAKARLRRGFTDPLSPFSIPSPDPAALYPSHLHRVTLMGYFGETMAGLAVESWGYAGKANWYVPAFLFRFHSQEFQHLESINQSIAAGQTYDPNATPNKRPGRTGDDCLAFHLDPTTKLLTDVLALEAKCIETNNATVISDAHEKLSSGPHLPSGIRELIELLEDYKTPAAQAWQRELLSIYKSNGANVKRHDAVTYICSNSPKTRGKLAWLPSAKPHLSYKVSRSLEAFEFHIDNIHQLVDNIYR